MGNLSALANNVVQTTPVGVIEAFAGVNAPAGWLFCDGSAISRIQYPELFSALSTTYGSGDGSTTFNLPDLRGRMPFGKGTHSDVATLGQNEGASLANRRPKHQHTVYFSDPGHVHQYGVYGGSFGDGSGAASLFTGFPLRETRSTGNNASNITIRVNPENSTSSTSPLDAPPYLVVNYIIKAFADLPRGGWFYQNQPPVVTQLPSNPQIGEEAYHLISGSLYHKRYDGTQWQAVANDLIANQVSFDKIATSQTNWAQNTPSAVSVNTTTPTTIATVTFTSRGRGPVLALAHGDANPAVQANWHFISLYLNGNAVNPFIINQTAGASWNNPWALTRMLGVLSAGSHTIQVRAWQGSGEITYGETGNNQAPSLVVVELI